MPRNGSGTYSLSKPPFTPNSTISSADVNSDFSDIATALTASIAADGQTPITGQLKFSSGTAAAPSHTFSSDLTTGMYLAGTGILGFSADEIPLILLDSTRVGTSKDGGFFQFGNGAIPCPVGVVQDFAGSAAPTGWFLCYGSAVSRTGYPELFDVIGTVYGIGDGSTTFNLPDLRGRGTYGKLNMGGFSATGATYIDTTTFGTDPTVLGAAGGGKSQTILQANLPSVNFTVSGIAISDTRTWASSNSLFPFAGGPGGIGAGSNVGVQATQAVTSTGGSLSITSQGTAASGGSGTNLSTVSPGMIFNKIIFAGRA